MDRPSVETATEFLVARLKDVLDNVRTQYSTYGYDIYIPNVLDTFLQGNNSASRFQGDSSNAKIIAPAFYEAAWNLCRRGVLRPQIRTIGLQATGDGASGNGYSITEPGRAWLKTHDTDIIMISEPGRFVRLTSKFGDIYGPAYIQRCQEAAKCSAANAYLACCVMCGAAAESILLAVARRKIGQESAERMYRGTGGRSRIEKSVFGQQTEEIKDRANNLLDLLKYWRDDSGHGIITEIDNWEAEEAQVRLIRLSNFIADRLNSLVQ